MSSDFEIGNHQTTSVSCCSCGGFVSLLGITLVVLGILMLAKVKILPEPFLKEKIELKTGIGWGSVALGIILGLCGRNMLQSRPALPKQSNTVNRTTSSESPYSFPQRSSERS